MSHKTLVNGTLYDVTGGKCLIGGTGYSIKKGRTLIDGTGYDIALGSKTWLINASLSDSSLDNLGYIPNYSGYVGPPFISNGNSFLGMSIKLSTGIYEEKHLIIYYYFLTEEGGTEPQTVYENPYGWRNEAYRTVTFEAEPTGNLLTWLEANAVPQQ